MGLTGLTGIWKMTLDAYGQPPPEIIKSMRPIVEDFCDLLEKIDLCE